MSSRKRERDETAYLPEDTPFLVVPVYAREPVFPMPVDVTNEERLIL